MRPRTRITLVVLAGAFGFLLALASGAAADITDPDKPFSPYRPDVDRASPGVAANAVPSRPAPTEPESSQPTAAEPAQPLTEVTAPPVAETVAVDPTPAPEHVVRRPALARTRSASAPSDPGISSPVIRDQGVIDKGLHTVRVFLGQVASACKVGVATGTGGPVLVFAVLSMATVLERRWVRRARWAADEDAPELLYAWDVIAPG